MDYNFGSCSFSDDRFLLRCEGREVPLRPKAVDLISILVSNPGRVIAKEELLEKIWPDVTVCEDSLTQCVHEIRSAMGPKNADLVRTVRGRGYMLDADVELARQNSEPLPAKEVLGRPASIFVAVATIAGIALFLFLSWVSTTDRTPNSVDPIVEHGILLTGSTILGSDFAYPEGKPLVASAIVTLQPGFEGGWHINTSPTFIYILEGAVEVEYDDGRIFRESSGKGFIEAVDEPHKARTLGTKPARFLVLDMGVEGRTRREYADTPAEIIARDN